MFTGIIEEKAKITQRGTNYLWIKATKVIEDIKPGSSIAVNGVCLTVLEKDLNSFKIELLPKTLELTNLGEVNVVNLERALRLIDRINGHILTGHVDFKSELIERIKYKDFLLLRFEVKPQVIKYLVKQGSIGVDGVSLTIMDIKDKSFIVHLTEYTQKLTTLGEVYPGYKANIEIDIFSKYLIK